MATQRSWLGSYFGQPRISRRRFVGGVAAGAGAAALIACSGGNSVERIAIDPSGVRKPGAVLYQKDEWKLADETDQAMPGGILTQREPSGLTESTDPYLATGGRGDRITDFAYEYLVVPNRAPGIDPISAEGEITRPHLAQDIEISDDALTYTFTLRRGVKYHPIAPVNGREMAIDDWKTSFDRYRQVAANRAAYLEVVDKEEFPDSRHMVIKMKAPYSPFLKRMWDYNFGVRIVPKELNTNPDILAQKMIGTSYRMIDKLEPTVTWEFKRWEEYWEGKSFIDRWHWPIIPENANAYSQFLAKNVIAYSPGARELLQVRGDAPDAILAALRIFAERITKGSFGRREAATSPWKDPRVRIAMHKMVPWDPFQQFESNREQLAAAGIEPELAYTTHVPWNALYFLDPRKNELGEASKNYFYDVAEARKLLEAAGYPDGFEIDFFAQSQSSAVTYQFDEWKKAGDLIRPKLNILARQEYADRVIARVDFKGLGVPQGTSGSDVDYLLFRCYHSNGPENAYPDAKLDELVQAQRRELDPLKRAERIKDLQRHVATTFHTLPGAHRFTTWRAEWPWLHNVNQRFTHQTWNEGHYLDHSFLAWLDGNMPRRNG